MADPGTDRERFAVERMRGQVQAVDHLAGLARDSADDVVACLHWLAAHRQAARYLRAQRPRPGLEQRQAAHHSVLERLRDEAQAQLAAADADAVHVARRGLGVRIALVGKGGAGKSLISGTLARLLARRGRPVLAADLDTNPGLAFTLGVPPTQGVLPAEAVEEHAGAMYGWRLRSDISTAELVARHAVVGPDGVRFLSLGKIGDTSKRVPRQTVGAFQELLAGFGEPGWDVIGDLEAGPTTPFERYHAFADRVVVVVTPTWVSAMTARRLLPMVDDAETLIIANQMGDEPDHAGLTPTVRIPIDPEVAEAERQGLSPIDCCPHSPTVAAVARLTDMLTNEIAV